MSLKSSPRLPSPRLLLPRLLLSCLPLLFCACSQDDDRIPRGETGGETSESLPHPAGATGSVTGMPDEPGPGQPIADGADTDGVTDPLVGIDGLPLPPEAIGPDGLPLPPEMTGEPIAGEGVPADPMAGNAASPAVAPRAMAEPGGDAAIAVVRTYYEAINASDFDRAHALWSDGGNASGQTAEQFAHGFADTAGVVAHIEAPGRIEGAAGSRFIEVPVAVEARTRDGGVRRFVGAYTLRRSVVDGASPAQRQWRIASADIREVRP